MANNCVHIPTVAYKYKLLIPLINILSLKVFFALCLLLIVMVVSDNCSHNVTGSTKNLFFEVTMKSVVTTCKNSISVLTR